MKKYVKFMAFALLAVFSLSFASCSSDDDDDETSSSWSDSDFIGTWAREYSEGWGVQNDGEEYIQLRSDGTYVDVTTYDSDGSYEVENGTWAYLDNKLILRPKSGSLSGVTLTYDIVKKEKNKLTVTIWGYTGHLVRVSDDVISKYLE